VDNWPREWVACADRLLNRRLVVSVGGLATGVDVRSGRWPGWCLRVEMGLAVQVESC
jgi:hypothetical protein